MNTMADGARERLVAQIGEALFGQPGLTLMELAEKVKGMRILAGRHDRARFEAWAAENRLNLACYVDMGDVFCDERTRTAWSAWQAAATLATVKHGGCVQSPTSERARFEDWGLAEGLPLARGRVGGYAFEVTAKAWLAWQHLSAQPSPGGQDARELLAAALDRHGLPASAEMIRSADYVKSPAIVASVDAVWCALAARQPVGEPVAYLDLGAGGYMDVGTDLSDDELAALPKGRHMLGIVGTYGVDGYKPAQAVDLGQPIPSELTPVVAALKRFDECAEDCGSEGCDIGRDWFDALTTMGLLRRTQRSPAVWTMTAEGERLLVLIDSHSEGGQP